MGITISTIADVAELTLLVNSAYRGESSKKGWTTESHLLSGNRIDVETLTEYINTPGITILKYTDNNKITGCVYLEKKGDKLYLGMLSVYPELQAAGIGRKLLEAAELYAAELNLHIISITVISTRFELIAWYKRRGYQPTGKKLPFHVETKFGVPHQPIVLTEMEKNIFSTSIKL